MIKYLIWDLFVFFNFLTGVENNIATLKPVFAYQISNYKNARFYKDTIVSEFHAKEIGITLRAVSKYDQAIDSILITKEKLRLFYELSQDKKQALDSIEKYFVDAFANKVAPYWYGTLWDITGTSQVPQQGYVGCSYFVSNTLSAMGFYLDRAGVARSSSRNIARTFQLCDSVVLLKGYTNSQIVDYFKENYNEGLFIIGMDFHAAFLLYYNNEVFVVHSGRHAGKVVIEYAETSTALVSNRLYIGEITTNNALMLKWLYGEYIPKIEIFEFS